jgi:hypothetical protein
MRLLIVIGFLLVAPSFADAQFPTEVRPGTRVRVWVPEPNRQADGPDRKQLLRGTVESVNAGTVRLGVPGTTGSLAIPRASVRRLDVSKGVSRGASMFERAVGGALAGAIVFGAMNDPRNSTGPNFRTDWEAAGVGAALGAGFGAVVGLIWPYERWNRVIR